MNATGQTGGVENGDQGSTGAVWWDHVVEFFDERSNTLIPVLIFLIAALVINIIQAWVLRRYARRMEGGGFRWTSAIASSLTAPLGVVIWVVGLTLALQVFLVPDTEERLNSVVVNRIADIRLGLILALGGWFLARAIRSIERVLVTSGQGPAKFDVTIVKAISNFLIIMVWLIILLMAMQSYGVNMTAIITVGGAGSFALTFAFQDVFKNLFGGLMILFTRPFKLGDGIELPGKKIMGSVEKIGLYQTIVRGWDSVPYILPNSLFIVEPVMNFFQRGQRRIKFTIGLRYEDFDRVEGIVKDIESLLAGQEQLDQDATRRANFANYGMSSLDINVLCFAIPGIATNDFFILQQDVLLEVGKIVSSHGADFAFQTTTIDMPVPPRAGTNA